VTLIRNQVRCNKHALLKCKQVLISNRSASSL